MFNLFKSKPSDAEIAAISGKCLAIAVGMCRAEKSLPEIQEFLAQTVAVTTNFSSREAATIVNNVMEVFFKSVQVVGATDDVRQRNQQSPSQ